MSKSNVPHKIKCCVSDCGRDAMYKKKRLCQKHYFRLMRNGKTDPLKPEEFKNYKKGHVCGRTQNAAGYQMIKDRGHPLAMANGYVYEHRFVIYSVYGESLPDCICGKKLTWSNVHIDHKDENVKNNKKDNLRPLCNWCNVSRGYKTPRHSHKNRLAITLNKVTMTAEEWSREEGVKVKGATIKARLRRGSTPFEAIYGKKITHKN